MRKFCFLSTLVLTLTASSIVTAQDFSNRGKDFWIAYAGHINGTSSVMGLYLTSDVNTSGNVQVGSVNIPFTIVANQVKRIFIGPNAGGDAPNTAVYNAQADGVKAGAGIHVTSQKNIVVYSHIIFAARSGATLILPTTVLGKEYVIPSYRNLGNDVSYSQITVVAVQPNTTIEITPKVASRSGTRPAGVPFQVTLANPGDVYQLQSQLNLDYSGSTVKSVSGSSGGCNPIAVFASTTWSGFDCTGSSGGDNLYQQLFPTKSWGKKFITAPFINKPYDIIRVFVTDPTTVVRKTELGVTTTLSPLQAGSYYEYKTANPTVIEADKAVSVVQYITSQTCGGGNSDPEMVLINPVEQTLTNITLFSAHQNYVPAGQTQVTAHYINIVIPTTHKSSLRIDNNPPTSPFVDIAGTGYTYVQENVTGSSAINPVHTVRADTGFTAIVYGYGNVESYGYNAGTNLRDLYQFISVDNNYASVDFPATCKGAPFSLSMTFPYEPVQIIWQFGGLYPDVTMSHPVYDQVSVVNGKTLYKYNLSGSYTAPATAGTYPIKIVAENPTADGCNGIQEIEFDFEVIEPPVAEFNFTTDGCVSNPVSFTDNTNNPGGRAIKHRHWDFGDAATQNDVVTTTHTYATPGSYVAKYTVINDIGCKSADTARHTVVLNSPPTAGFTIDGSSCAGQTLTFRDASTGAGIAKWNWDFGDGPPATVNSNTAQTHTYATPGSYSVKLWVETASGCRSVVFQQSVTIHANPVVSFTMPGNICIAENPAQFASTSTISDGTESQFTYTWDFGDATPAGSGQAVSHTYTGTGPFPVKLTVKSNNNCTADLTKTISTLYAEPVANFNPPADVCLGTAVNFTDLSNAPGSTVTQWNWDFGDLTSAPDQNPVKTYAAAGTYTVKLTVTSAQGCRSVNNTATRSVTVSAIPVADFSIGSPGCVSQSITLTDNSSATPGNLVKWTWDLADGGGPTTLSTGAPAVHTYATAGTYPVTLQVETDKGCKSTVTSKNVVINPLPVPDFTTPVVCISDQAPFAGTATIPSGNVTGWEWNFGDANATPGNPNVSTAQNPAHQFTVAGNYTVQLTATSSDGCKNSISHTLSVNGNGLTPGFTLVNTDALCSNKDITIKDASAIDAGRIIRVEIFWDPADLTIKTVDNSPVVGKTYLHTYPPFGSPASKTYRVRYDIYSGINCFRSYFDDIILQAVPELVFDPVTPVCSNEPAFSLTPNLHLINTLPGEGAFSGTGVSPAGQFTPGTAGNGPHPITYTFEADNGCTSTAQQPVVVNPTPVADAGPDKFVLEGGRATLTPGLINNMQVSYEWSPAIWLNNPLIPNAVVSPLGDRTYLLTVTSDEGCFDTDEVFIKLLLDPVIPNIFSPNGDGIHDKWVIESLESYPGCVVQIYNRYGQAIYKAVNYTTPWDGRVNGKDVPVGTYYYIIDPKNGRKPITGYLDIIR